MYLPEAPKQVNLFGDDVMDLDNFLGTVHRYRKLYSLESDQGGAQDFDGAGTILEGMRTCAELSRTRDEWAGKTQIFLGAEEPLPEWVTNRIEELRSMNLRRDGRD